MDHYAGQFESRREKVTNQPEFVRRLQQQAFDCFTALGFPTTRQEAWRFTNVASLARTRFHLPNGQAHTPQPDRLQSLSLPDTRPIAVVNGRLVPNAEANTRLTIESLRTVLNNHPERIEPYLGQLAAFGDQTFVAWNTAFFEDGLYLYVPPESVLEQPLHLLFVADPATPETVFHQRLLIHLGRNSRAAIVEHYSGPDGIPYFTNGVTEIILEDNAVLKHVKFQQEGDTAYHFTTSEVHLHRDSQLSTHHFATGGKLVRNDIAVRLNGPGADLTLNGLNLLRRRQHNDCHTLLDHRQPQGTSREYFKNILTGQAQGVFSGLVTVQPQAQQTDAFQTNKNLLLSRTASMNSNPQLEIYADNVKCSHGSTTGELDEDALFYLRSRGIDRDLARSLLIKGFANEVIEPIPIAQAKTAMARHLENWLNIIGASRQGLG
jgi:Fe-S cluster assembly protein SufD